MIPDNLTGLTNVLLTAGAAGAVLAFAYLAGQRMMRSDRVRLWVGAALVAIPGLLLGWAVTRPELGVTTAYGEFTEAILGSTTNPVVDARPAPRPVVRRTHGSGVGAATAGRPSASPTAAVPAAQGETDSPPPDISPSPSPSETPSETPSPTPTPSETPSSTPTPSPSETPSPTPTQPPSPDADEEGDPTRDEAPPPPPPEPSES